MFLVTANKTRQLLHLSYIQRVKPVELQRGREDLKSLLAELAPGFRVFVDFGRLEAMGLDCVPEIGLSMELMDQHGVGLVVRLIPDPTKDIGLNILTVFHYKRRPRIVSCKNLLEVTKALAL
jgi:hypothetical protein